MDMRRVAVVLGSALFLIGGYVQAQVRSNENRIRILTFRLTANRITPASITVPKGKYLIRVNNGVFSGPVTVDLLRGAPQGDRISMKNVPAGKGRDSLEIELTPGQHMLRVSPRANWVAQINVQQ